MLVSVGATFPTTPYTYIVPIPIVPPIVARMYDVWEGQVSRPSSAFAGGGTTKLPTLLRTFIFRMLESRCWNPERVETPGALLCPCQFISIFRGYEWLLVSLPIASRPADKILGYCHGVHCACQVTIKHPNILVFEQCE